MENLEYTVGEPIKTLPTYLDNSRSAKYRAIFDALLNSNGGWLPIQFSNNEQLRFVQRTIHRVAGSRRLDVATRSDTPKHVLYVRLVP